MNFIEAYYIVTYDDINTPEDNSQIIVVLTAPDSEYKSAGIKGLDFVYQKASLWFEENKIDALIRKIERVDIEGFVINIDKL